MKPTLKSSFGRNIFDGDIFSGSGTFQQNPVFTTANTGTISNSYTLTTANNLN